MTESEGVGRKTGEPKTDVGHEDWQGKALVVAESGGEWRAEDRKEMILSGKAKDGEQLKTETS